MICYPASSSILSADEIEYISGGSSDAGAVFSLVGAVFSVINAINVVNIKHDLREKIPTKIMLHSHVMHITPIWKSPTAV